MNIEQSVMAITVHEARASYVAYRKAVQDKRATKDDRALLRALKAILAGKKVLDLGLAIGHAGRDALGRPRLAVCRADSPTVTYEKWHRNHEFKWGALYREKDVRKVIRLDESVFSPPPAGANWNSIRATAIVPGVPPQFRPADDLKNYHILWEAVRDARPPVDPLLIKHVSGPFFVVLAAWDLTPLEQAMLRGR